MKKKMTRNTITKEELNLNNTTIHKNKRTIEYLKSLQIRQLEAETPEQLRHEIERQREVQRELNKITEMIMIGTMTANEALEKIGYNNDYTQPDITTRKGVWK